MPTVRNARRSPLPRRFEQLVRMMSPQAIMDDVHYANTLDMIDGLMASGRLSAGQALYLETLVQLVAAYEGERYPIRSSDISGLEALKHVLGENGMTASDLARLLGVHASLGSKILKGERSLTVPHLKKLADRFKVNPGLFMD